LEDAIDRGHSNAADLEKVLNGMEKQGYQRDATVIENRQKRKDREEALRLKTESEKKKAEI
jgi:hypothetical protein